MSESNYFVFGLDLGISSVGWSVVEYYTDDSQSGDNLAPKRLIDLGVRHFDAAENPKTKESPNLERRIKRGMRRMIRRRKFRVYRLRQFLKRTRLLEENQTFSSKEVNPYEVRTRALDERVSNYELSLALCHLCKHRGFQSNRKSGKKSTEDGKVLAAISESRLLVGKYRSAGEMLYKDKLFSKKKRNSSGDYSHTMLRSDILAELHAILTKQQELGNSLLTDEIVKSIHDIVSAQRPFASGDDVLKLVGECRFEPGELRASKFAPTFEYFRLLQELNNLNLYPAGKRYQTFQFTEEQKQRVVQFALTHSRVTYNQIRSTLDLADDIRFERIAYPYTATAPTELFANEKKKTFVSMEGHHVLSKIVPPVGNSVQEIVAVDRRMLLDSIATAITFYQTEEDIREQLSRLELDGGQVGELLQISNFSGTAHLSLKAMHKLIPFLEQALSYKDAVKQAGYDDAQVLSGRNRLLPPVPTEEVRNAVVLRTLTQARKVVNALIRKYESPVRIHVEVARDLNMPVDIRRKIERLQNERGQKNELIKGRLQSEFGLNNITGFSITAYKLWEEQNGKCIYSGKYIEPQLLFTDNAVQIDHAMPYSRTLDDSYKNKVLCLTSENQKKKNRTPFEYFGNDENAPAWKGYATRIESLVIPESKKRHLLSTLSPKADMALSNFMNRNLSDTRYICRYFSQFLRQNLLFADHKSAVRVFSVTGETTAQLRRYWGLSKDRSESLKHHALDAAVVAVCSPSTIYQIQQWAGKREELFSAEGFHSPEPWDSFRDDVLDKLGEVFVSRMPKRTVSGALHEETIYSVKNVGEGIVTKRVDITALKTADIDRVVESKAVRDILRERLSTHGNDGKKAFAEPIYKPSKSGKQNQIKKVTVWDTKSSLVSARKDGEGNTIGVAANDSQVRTDVFKKSEKYFLCPVYSYDVAVGKLPNRVIGINKSESDWPVLNGDYKYCFSLFPNDYVRAAKKGEITEGYFSGTHRRMARLELKSHDVVNAGDEGLGISAQSCNSIEKYAIDVLGEKHLVTETARPGVKDGF